jgi:8-oxo-dGTP diphosphatase
MAQEVLGMLIVVGAAIRYDGRVLAARRTGEHPGWEFPGGKVEPGETAEVAAAREIAEELGCTVEVTGWLPGEVEVRPGLVLRVALARLVSGEPVPTEHDMIRWLRADQVDEVDWLPADLPFLPALAAALTPRG